ncbi:DUF6049 family protein [Saccharothrix australiensis]|uniref:Glycoprotein n=1 Tax=Saccharothrix australiensis TaxID=2072 RepID=A0A495VVZ0_9PSEU|nr:DUF6049 family protein [Saccharothrix australiensis]RKT51818.1 hypothetical protein C8E97_0305 [Saccharothrix australiensis]
MKRLLSALAAAGLLLVGTPASAAPADGGRIPVKPAPATQVWATRPASYQPGGTVQQRLRLDIENLSPRVVTAGADSVTISGKVVNVGDRDIFDLELRLERGDPLTGEEDVRHALREPAGAESVQPWFTPIAGELRRGESKPFSLTVPVNGPGNTSLRIDQPGVYPILANINGRPDYGDRARLAALSTLLPVLAVPGGATLGAPPNPAKITLLWPLADRPRMVSGGLEPVLTDDDLATSLALGGRLHSLLKAYESALDGPLGSAVCLAVDPDLLRTVQAMSRGYQVRDQGAGKGRNDAELWLAQVKLLAGGRCVVALPDADADLVALSRAKLADLSALANKGADTVREVLQVQALPGLAWPEDGVIDQQTLSDLVAQGITSLVVDQSAVAGTPGTGPVRLDAGAGKPVTAVRVDGMVSDALRGPVVARPVAGITTPSETLPVSVQNALAALAFRTGFQGDGRNVVISPPRRWNAPTGEVNTFLQITKSLVAGGFATPLGLDALLGAPPERTAALSYPVEAGAQEVPPAVTADVAASWHELQRLHGAMNQQDAESTKPGALVDPLRQGLLRSVSGAWRGNEAGARAALAIADDQLGALRGRVTVSEPNSPILLASADSPIPVTIRNRLDVRITVRIVVEDTPGIIAQQLPDQVLPARGDRQLTVPVEVLRSGRFPVHIRLTTPDGVELGERARLEVSSSAYGTITIVITVLAGALLVLLSARRIFRRARASRSAAAAPPAPARGAPADAGGAVTPEKSSTS